MSVRILCGDRIQSVTVAVLSDVRNSSVRWPEQQGIILVPEYRKLTVERQYLEQDDAAAFMMTEVLSFNRLAMRLLAALGLSTGATMTPQLRAMVLRRVMYENRAGLQHYGSLRYNSAFLRELDQLIGEMRRFGINAGRLAGLSPIDETQRRKFHDLAILLNAYEAFIEGHGLYDRDHWQRLLAAHLRRLSAAKRA